MSGSQSFFTVSLGLSLSFNNLKSFHLSFDQLSIFNELPLVFNIARGKPGFDLIAKPLQLLDFFLEIRFIFFFLIAVCCIVYLLPDIFESFYSLCDFLKTPLDFTLQSPLIGHLE